MGKGGWCRDWCPKAAGWLTGLTSSDPKLPLTGGGVGGSESRQESPTDAPEFLGQLRHDCVLELWASGRPLIPKHLS